MKVAIVLLLPIFVLLFAADHSLADPQPVTPADLMSAASSNHNLHGLYCSPKIPETDNTPGQQKLIIDTANKLHSLEGGYAANASEIQYDIGLYYGYIAEFDNCIQQ